MPQEDVRGTPATSMELTPLPPDGLAWLRAIYGVWNRGGAAAMKREVWPPDIVMHDPPDFPDSTVTRGADALAEHLERRMEALGWARITVVEGWWVREGEIFLVELRLASGGKASGVRLPEVPLFHVHRLSEGRTVEFWEYMRREQALEAVDHLRGPSRPA